MVGGAFGLGLIVGTPDIGIPGQAGTLGFVTTNALVVLPGDTLVRATINVAPGMGGSNVLARGGRSFVVPSGSNANGIAGIFGGGGTGAGVADNTAEPDGGLGGDGILIVEEYS
jgi:hypothetical protein